MCTRRPARSTIGFAKPRVNVGSPGDVGGQNNSRGLGGGGGSRPKADPVREEAGGGGKRKACRMLQYLSRWLVCLPVYHVACAYCAECGLQLCSLCSMGVERADLYSVPGMYSTVRVS